MLSWRNVARFLTIRAEFGRTKLFWTTRVGALTPPKVIVENWMPGDADNTVTVTLASISTLSPAIGTAPPLQLAPTCQSPAEPVHATL
jgi:hypothetical protein